MNTWIQGGNSMSCESEVFTSNCVCDTLLAIVEAQEQVEDSGCTYSCNQSIQELVGGLNASAYNTIPVMLTCKGDCDIFVGTGVARSTAVPTGFDVGRAVVFRVADVDPETCCATLELLQFFNPDVDDTALIANVETVGLQNTNVCITVDLNCFCAVTCLPATTI